MSKMERIYYFAIIVIEVLVIAFLSFKFIKLRDYTKERMHDRSPLTTSGGDRLYSFWGENKTGEKKLVLFTAYSKKYYIFVKFSPDCDHCTKFIDEYIAFFLNMDYDKDITLFLLAEEPTSIVRDVSPIKLLKVPFADLFQFGTEIPTLIAVNGKGEVLLKRVGYYDNIFEDALETIGKNKFRKSKKIE